MKYGQGGRLSFNGNVVTVFGATGVLGQYVVSQLARQGTQIIVPYRSSEDDIRDIRVMGDLGQIVFLQYDVRDYDSIVKSLSHSTAAINLVGKNIETRNFSFQACHVDAAAAIASADLNVVSKISSMFLIFKPVQILLLSSCAIKRLVKKLFWRNFPPRQWCDRLKHLGMKMSY